MDAISLHESPKRSSHVVRVLGFFNQREQSLARTLSSSSRVEEYCHSRSESGSRPDAEGDLGRGSCFQIKLEPKVYDWTASPSVFANSREHRRRWRNTMWRCRKVKGKRHLRVVPREKRSPEVTGRVNGQSVLPNDAEETRLVAKWARASLQRTLMLSNVRLELRCGFRRWKTQLLTIVRPVDWFISRSHFIPQRVSLYNSVSQLLISSFLNDLSHCWSGIHFGIFIFPFDIRDTIS